MGDRASADGSALLRDLVEVSRAIGADPRLTLHGGGNTSVKTVLTDVTGRAVPTLYVKGSGHDLATIGPEGFAPLRLERLRELLGPVRISDIALKNELRCALLDAAAPDPSVETLVHAQLPHVAVLHSHADVILTLTNTEGGEDHIREAYGARVVVVPYVMPGPDLAAACQLAWQDQAHEGTEGIVVLNHGLFSLGDSPHHALERHVSLIDTAAQYLAELLRVNQPSTPRAATDRPPDIVALAELRARISAAAGIALIMRRTTDRSIAALSDDEWTAAVQRGPLTPDHVIWTKRIPMVGTDVEGFTARYREYFNENLPRAAAELTMTDPAPRVVLDAKLGLLTLGRSGREAQIAQDITRHTLAAVAQAERIGGYLPASAGHVFDLEYWDLEQEKLRRSGAHKPLAGQIALVTGAASGIGRACAAALLDAGASVIGWDLAPNVPETFTDTEWLGQVVDVTDNDQVEAGLRAGVETFGGLDIAILAAGVFPTSQRLTELSMDVWRRTMAVNVDSAAALLGRVQPLLRLAPEGGRVVLVASKNVAAPGPGAAAYSASKAALTQLARVAALEWAPEGIRVNTVHPDAVFDTGLWTPQMLSARAAHYGVGVEEYKRRNLLRTEVTSAAVGRLVRAMVDETFACTTGAQVPIDGGNDRVI